MNEVFVDTSGWASFFLEKDSYHAKAFRLVTEWQQRNRCVVTTNYVLGELVSLFTHLRVPRIRCLNYIEILRSVDWVEIVHIGAALDKKAWQLLVNRLDKKWSLVDCASFVVMQERGMTEALTADRHFEQAGFVRLLK